jgi:hypothetical protein
MKFELNHIKWVTPKMLWEECGFPEGGIRHWLFHRQTNGLAKAVRKVGRKLFIDYEAFLAWIDSHQSSQGGSSHGL